MRFSNISYNKMVRSARRRKAMRRATVIVFLTFAMAYLLPNIVSIWQYVGDRVVESMRPYRPYDFEREAWLAGQQIGEENESMTKTEYRKYYKKQISEAAPDKTTRTFKIYDFAFDAGYKTTSDYQKRSVKK